MKFTMPVGPLLLGNITIPYHELVLLVPLDGNFTYSRSQIRFFLTITSQKHPAYVYETKTYFSHDWLVSRVWIRLKTLLAELRIRDTIQYNSWLPRWWSVFEPGSNFNIFQINAHQPKPNSYCFWIWNKAKMFLKHIITRLLLYWCLIKAVDLPPYMMIAKVHVSSILDANRPWAVLLSRRILRGLS